jgi:ketosteroid isomerase-like protein
MNHDPKDFERFLKRREEAASAYVTGDAEPLRDVATRALPATFFGPGGGFRQGAEEVFSTYEKDVKAFEPGGDSHFEILQMAAGDGVAYWVGFQHANARLKGKSEAVPMKLRVTELFRREGDEWKLVHRHADMLASEPEGKKES